MRGCEEWEGGGGDEVMYLLNKIRSRPWVGSFHWSSNYDLIQITNIISHA